MKVKSFKSLFGEMLLYKEKGNIAKSKELLAILVESMIQVINIMNKIDELGDHVDKFHIKDELVYEDGLYFTKVGDLVLVINEEDIDTIVDILEEENDA